MLGARLQAFGAILARARQAALRGNLGAKEHGKLSENSQQACNRTQIHAPFPIKNQLNRKRGRKHDHRHGHLLVNEQMPQRGHTAKRKSNGAHEAKQRQSRHEGHDQHDDKRPRSRIAADVAQARDECASLRHGRATTFFGRQGGPTATSLFFSTCGSRQTAAGAAVLLRAGIPHGHVLFGRLRSFGVALEETPDHRCRTAPCTPRAAEERTPPP